jgi:hypothetical protein
VCELVTQCSQYDQKRVRFKAEFISDGLENSSLVDTKKCSQAFNHGHLKLLIAILTSRLLKQLWPKDIEAQATNRLWQHSQVGTNADLKLLLTPPAFFALNLLRTLLLRHGTRILPVGTMLSCNQLPFRVHSREFAA